MRGGDSGEAVRVGLGLPVVAAQQHPRPRDTGDESREQQGGDDPVDDRVETVGVERAGGVDGVE